MILHGLMHVPNAGALIAGDDVSMQGRPLEMVEGEGDLPRSAYFGMLLPSSGDHGGEHGTVHLGQVGDEGEAAYPPSPSGAVDVVGSG